MKRLIQHIFLIGSLTIGLAINASAQSGYSTLSYNVGFPMSDMKDFTGNVSGRGVSFDYNYLFQDNIAIGLGVSWQTFTDDLGYQSNVDGTSTISGYEYHYVNSFPIHVTGTYFMDGDSFKPFFGLGIGTIYNMTDTDVGVFRFEDNQWHFSLRPEAGVQFDLNYRTGLRLSAKYNYAFSAGDIGSFSYFALGAGIVWMY